MTEYQPDSIEKKWQAVWEETGVYRSQVDWSRPKHYALTMLPYPSGDLHMGHWVAMTPSDARARFMRMRGFNVLFPMGFDAFGLPAENAAVQRNIHPWKWTYANIERMQVQMRRMGAMFDWEREAISCTPQYYKWTEWFFKQFFENGIAYRKEAMVNWSDALQTVLANEQVIDGKDERLGQPVVQKLMEQWFFKITDYADELLEYPDCDWPEFGKLMQRNWIGRSEGAKVTFGTEEGDLVVFTTRPDTLWGATFMVLAPEHKLVDALTTDDNRDAVAAYKVQAASQSEIERTSESKAKTGVFTGSYATNPVNGKQVPIWIADYVMITYGTGAIMAVPAHDQRDFDFARTFGLTIIPVIQPEGEDALSADSMEVAYVGAGTMINSEVLDGTAVTQEKGRKNPSVAAAIDYISERGTGEEHVNYRMRDWLVSRQRYWGSPIPIVYTQSGEFESVADKDLPVILPPDSDFEPTGRSPLTLDENFLNTTDSQGRPARRETDTMDTFMCSSWYHLRYLSPDYDGGPFDPEEAAYWLPVDTYTGGSEHYTMHLLYTRFFNKVMRDLGMFDETFKIMDEHGRETTNAFDEPMIQMRNQGQILGAERVGDFILCSGRWDGSKLYADKVVVGDKRDVTADFAGVAGELMGRTENILRVDAGGGQTTIVELSNDGTVEISDIDGANTVNMLKHHLEIQRMSKSKGNVVNPDEYVEQYGADTVRGYLMFAFDWQKGGPWDPKGIMGVKRFIQDVWEIGRFAYTPTADVADSANRDMQRKLHQTIDKITRSMDNFSFNTSVAALMALRNVIKDAQKAGNVSVDAWNETVDNMLLMLAPVAPHITEELWAERGNGFSIHQQSWPEFDAELAKDDEITLILQVNGKVRGRVQMPADISREDAEKVALADEGVLRHLDGKTPRKVIVVPGRLVNVVL